MTNPMTPIQPYIDQFGHLRADLPGAGLPWLDRLRTAGLERFSAQGFPTIRAEAWKYTNLRSLEKIAFAPATRGTLAASIDALPTVMPAGSPSHRLVFVDGRFRAELSSPGALPAGVELTSLAAALDGRAGWIEEHLGQIGDADARPLLALNTAFLADGAVLRLPRGTVVTAPIELVFVGTATEGPAVWHPRTLIVAEDNSEATVVEHHVGIGDGTYFANGATEVVVGAGARLHHYKVQRESLNAFHLSSVTARLGRDATYDNFILTLGARLARNEVIARLDGTGVTCRLNGAYMVRGSQHCDTTTVIDHALPHGSSREVYKGVIDQTARAVFQGKIIVRPGAQKTDGYQINRALLLSDHAEIDSKPELEIYADDVKCSHGATAGELDENALFYLRARGIDKETARGLLVAAFLGEAVDEIRSEPVREAFLALVSSWLSAR